MKEGEEDYVDLPEDLGYYDESAGVIMIESSSEVYIGLHTIRVNFTMQDYLADQQPLTTEFYLKVYPPLDLQLTKQVKPEFDLDSIDGTTAYNRTVGQEWEFKLPNALSHEYGYEVEYETVNLNDAVIFA